ncbi:MAG: DUF1801 domain-containing protein [Taibaiella sp.]|nr:DUF1801 domain-containing protein [Taibaiella sp.]
MRNYILSSDPAITETWKYAIPVYCYNGKMCCYIRVDKKSGVPYLGLVEGAQIHHPLLVQGERARMKVILLDPAADLPIEALDDILGQMFAYHKLKGLSGKNKRAKGNSFSD